MTRPRRVRAFRLLALGVCATLATLACGAPSRESAPAGSAQPADAAAPLALQAFDFGGDFTLTSHDGRPSSLRESRGRVRLLFFGFTHCPDVCPLTLSRVARAIDALQPGDRADVVTLFATVDVDRDTPAVLAKYLSGLPIPVTGLTGSRADVDAVVAQYKATYAITPSDSAAGPTVSHSTYLYLIDRDDRVRFLFRMSDTPDRIAEGIRLALRAPRLPAHPPS